ncbi:carbamoyl-phosphate synthase (glutamine-hydrolyzing) small subunit [Deinococcus metallilatus]|uniref:Carbamoyl phosphate synthase small chain n=2 Tax=Deinococcus TaxID=1298 RepID=A0AAJ5JXP5_9DEIO|nr:glutamine-hydrolyzing carbamoyl-phosphate synthase small subunit [Deinococcus metallilatus]MBB5296189.1 carbamoyl-phosphate synthase small subunit [Deinococcus metallilatus]QBY09763.1 carbamoyl-phosphate synthase (glutamine-hydrolyzing) small subunit [Deinococcus metallilatus]RXJ08961.1 carbamoyl-phosphate synthase (glutamine-hydrolyzing) small subunit [Deinococcus metallilatus]TLK23660.1 glutamine-hydrolyzing carbamoyl-phosphate synthase small subunit [Deinococcus metallilatus]GMA14055.1 c
MIRKERAILALEDGTVYRGYAFGHRGETVGEVVFNTSMTGYQEIMTDPSYNGQIVTITYPHVGNYGVAIYDMESNKPYVRGFISREFSGEYSNHRAQQSLEAFMQQYGVVSIQGIDTRALVRRLRTGGVVKGVIAHRSYTHPEDPYGEFTPAEEQVYVQRARDHQDIDGHDMTREVTTPLPYAFPTLRHGKRVVLMDFGIKHTIIERLSEVGIEPIVVPAHTTPAQIMALQPHGLFLSNGPGDPAPLEYAHKTAWELMGLLPTFGICLGHQILGLAAGGQTFKMKFGHRGGNQPVKNLLTGNVEITSQNHGYAVDIDSIPNGAFVATHVNLNDGTLEGMAHSRYPVFSVQYHPEASPGPHDSRYLFDRFIEEIDAFDGANGSPVLKASAGRLGV